MDYYSTPKVDLAKLELIIPPSDYLKNELRYSVSYLGANRLHESSKWISEILKSLHSETQGLNDSDAYMERSDLSHQDDKVDNLTDENQDYPLSARSDFTYTFFERPGRVNDSLQLARTLFDLREYRKTAFILKPFLSEKNQSILFLYYYSMFLISEQQIEEEHQNGESS